MSLISWKAEFYPVQAVLSILAGVPLEHSIRKWEGLLKRNLLKHGVTRVSESIRITDGNDSFAITKDTCALCMLYQNCDPCPITKFAGTTCLHVLSAYDKWLDKETPRPMLNLLNKLKKLKTNPFENIVTGEVLYSKYALHCAEHCLMPRKPNIIPELLPVLENSTIPFMAGAIPDKGIVDADRIFLYKGVPCFILVQNTIVENPNDVDNMRLVSVSLNYAAKHMECSNLVTSIREVPGSPAETV